MRNHRQKRAVIIAPIPCANISMERDWLCITLDGNMRYQSVSVCHDKWDAMQWMKRTRNHLRKRGFNIEVCTRLAP